MWFATPPKAPGTPTKQFATPPRAPGTPTKQFATPPRAPGALAKQFATLPRAQSLTDVNILGSSGAMRTEIGSLNTIMKSDERAILVRLPCT